MISIRNEESREFYVKYNVFRITKKINQKESKSPYYNDAYFSSFEYLNFTPISGGLRGREVWAIDQISHVLSPLWVRASLGKKII